MTKPSRRILFIHPLGVNWLPGETDVSRVANIMAPIGLCSLAAWVERHGHRADIHDCYAYPGQDDQIDAYLRTHSPDFVGFSATTSSFLDAARIARRIQAAYPRVRTVFGGVHVSALGERAMRDYPEIDYAVAGEGEEALLALLDSNGEGAESVPGLIWRRGEEIVAGGPRDGSLDLDSLPFPAYEKLRGFPSAYKLPIFSYPRAPGATTITSRGCPFRCAYCDRSVFGQQLRQNSARYVFDLFRHLRKTFGVRHISSYDDNFTLDRARIEEICELLLRARLGLTFNCGARPEHLDPDLLALMKRAGCWTISLGIESGDRDLLARHRLRVDPEQVRRCVGWIKKAGIRAKGLFMLGLPGETDETIERTIAYTLSLPLDEINVTKFTPFPGSPLYRDIRRWGEFDENWELMNCLNSVFIPQGLSRERFEERYKEFYRRYFERWPVLLRFVAMAWRSPDSCFRFLRHLRTFWRVRSTHKKAKSCSVPPR